MFNPNSKASLDAVVQSIYRLQLYVERVESDLDELAMDGGFGTNTEKQQRWRGLMRLKNQL